MAANTRPNVTADFRLNGLSKLTAPDSVVAASVLLERRKNMMARTTPVAPVTRIGTAMFRIRSWLNTPICISSLGNMTDDANSTATAKTWFHAGSSVLRLAKLNVVTVLEASPPISPVRPMPAPWPSALTRI